MPNLRCERFGPFDGVAGVSEGAIVAQWLCMKHSQPESSMPGSSLLGMIGADDSVDLGPFARFKFCLNIVGPPPDLDFDVTADEWQEKAVEVS